MFLELRESSNSGRENPIFGGAACKVARGFNSCQSFFGPIRGSGTGVALVILSQGTCATYKMIRKGIRGLILTLHPCALAGDYSDIYECFKLIGTEVS